MLPILPFRRGLMPFALCFLLAACGGGGNDNGGGGGSGSGSSSGGSIGDPGAYAYARALDYLSVIQHSASFDECLAPNPSISPYLCLRGPRSGTGLGGAVHQWMQQQLSAIPQLQYQQVQKFSFPRFVPKGYSLSVDQGNGSSFAPAVFPWYYQGSTGAAGIDAPLADAGDGGTLALLTAGNLSGKIVLLQMKLTFQAGDNSAQDTLDAIAAKGAAGAIVTFDGAGNGPDNQVVLQSYDITRGTNGKLPTLLVGRDDGATLKSLKGQTAHLVVNATQATGSVTNEVAMLPGADKHNILVIGTPLNGWATVGGERGPGVGIFLYLAQYLAHKASQAPLPYTVYFVATGGHDVYASGLEQFLACIPSERIVAYVHLAPAWSTRATTTTCSPAAWRNPTA